MICVFSNEKLNVKWKKKKKHQEPLPIFNLSPLTLSLNIAIYFHKQLCFANKIFQNPQSHPHPKTWP